MALIKCPDCGKEHSDLAPACPQCGRPNKTAESTAPKKTITYGSPSEKTAAPQQSSNDKKEAPKGCVIGCLGSIVLFFILVVIASLNPDTKKPDEWDQISAKVYCSSRIKELLRDPDSYQFVSAVIGKTSGEYKQNGTALITFRSKNGFGGYVQGLATCEAYEKNGERWVKAKLYE